MALLVQFYLCVLVVTKILNLWFQSSDKGSQGRNVTPFQNVPSYVKLNIPDKAKAFVLQNVITIIPLELLNNLQGTINKFICGGRKARIKASTMQLPIEGGSVAGPNLLLYYHAAMLSAAMQWWIGQNRVCWNMEQSHVQVVLLMEKEDRLSKESKGIMKESVIVCLKLGIAIGSSWFHLRPHL